MMTAQEANTLRNALERAMHFAAAYTGRCRTLQRFAQADPASFERIAAQTPDSLELEIAHANRHFAQAKAAYETHCQAIGQPAYATWDID